MRLQRGCPLELYPVEPGSLELSIVWIIRRLWPRSDKILVRRTTVAYVSELENRPVVDIDGEHVGTLNDLLAARRGEMLHPQVIALVVKRRGSLIIISINDIAVL